MSRKKRGGDRIRHRRKNQDKNAVSVDDIEQSFAALGLNEASPTTRQQSTKTPHPDKRERPRPKKRSKKIPKVPKPPKTPAQVASATKRRVTRAFEQKARIQAKWRKKQEESLARAERYGQKLTSSEDVEMDNTTVPEPATHRFADPLMTIHEEEEQEERQTSTLFNDAQLDMHGATIENAKIKEGERRRRFWDHILTVIRDGKAVAKPGARAGLIKAKTELNGGAEVSSEVETVHSRADSDEGIILVDEDMMEL